MKMCVEVAALPNGAHRNVYTIYCPPGWVVVPESVIIPPSFPFVDLVISGGELVGMTAKAVPQTDKPQKKTPMGTRVADLETDMLAVKPGPWQTTTYTVTSSNAGRDVVMLNLAPDIKDMIVKVNGTMDSNHTIYFTLAVDGVVDVSLELSVTFATDVSFYAGNDGGLMSGYVKRNATTQTEKVATETNSNMMGTLKSGKLTGFRLGESKYLKVGSIVEVIYR